MFISSPFITINKRQHTNHLG